MHHGAQKAVRTWQGYQRYVIVIAGSAPWGVTKAVLIRRSIGVAWLSCLWILALCWVGSWFLDRRWPLCRACEAHPYWRTDRFLGTDADDCRTP